MMKFIWMEKDGWVGWFCCLKFVVVDDSNMGLCVVIEFVVFFFVFKYVVDFEVYFDLVFFFSY